MTVSELLAELTRRGIRLEAHGDRLRFSPKAAMAPDLLARLREHKAELLAVLRRDPEAPAIELTDVSQVWRATLNRLEGDPLFPPEVMESLRAAGVRWSRRSDEMERE